MHDFQLKLKENHNAKCQGYALPPDIDIHEKCKGKGCKECDHTGKLSVFVTLDLIRDIEILIEYHEEENYEGLFTAQIDDFSGNEDHIEIRKEDRPEFEENLIRYRDALGLLEKAKNILEGWHYDR
jgi:hypothetical protein